METDRLRRLIAEGRYEVDAKLVAEAIVDTFRGSRRLPPQAPPRPGHLQFDSRVIPPRR